MPTPDAILRASGRLSVLRGRRPDRRSSAGSASVHHAAKAWSGAPGQNDHRRFSQAAHGRSAAGLQGNAVGENLATHAQGRHRRVGTADAGAADHQKQVACARIERGSDRRRIAPRGRDRGDLSARGSRALGDEIRRHGTAGNIDDAQARAAHLQPRDAGGARQQKIARQNAPAGLDDAAACGNIAAGPPYALPRDRLRQHLRHRTGDVDGIGIEHAIAALGNRLAGLDPCRRRRQRQRRIGGRADQIVRAEGEAVGGGDVAWTDAPRAVAFRPQCSAALRSAAVPPARPVPRPSKAHRAPYRAASAWQAGAGTRSWFAYALNRAGNKQNHRRSACTNDHVDGGHE